MSGEPVRDLAWECLLAGLQRQREARQRETTRRRRAGARAGWETRRARQKAEGEP